MAWHIFSKAPWTTQKPHHLFYTLQPIPDVSIAYFQICFCSNWLKWLKKSWIKPIFNSKITMISRECAFAKLAKGLSRHFLGYFWSTDITIRKFHGFWAPQMQVGTIFTLKMPPTGSQNAISISRVWLLSKFHVWRGNFWVRRKIYFKLSQLQKGRDTDNIHFIRPGQMHWQHWFPLVRSNHQL